MQSTLEQSVETKATAIPIELLTDLRQLKDQRDELARKDSDLSRQVQAIQAKLMQFHEQTGLEKFSGAGLSVSINPNAMRVKYDPEKWQGIVKWAIDSGNEHIVQRRLTDTKVISLIEEGVALPDGLGVETFATLTVRRV